MPCACWSSTSSFIETRTVLWPCQCSINLSPLFLSLSSLSDLTQEAPFSSHQWNLNLAYKSKSQRIQLFEVVLILKGPPAAACVSPSDNPVEILPLFSQPQENQAPNIQSATANSHSQSPHRTNQIGFILISKSCSLVHRDPYFPSRDGYRTVTGDL